MVGQRIDERRQPASTQSHLTAALMLLTVVTVVPVVPAAAPERLDEDFLEYLAGLEDDNDNWTWFVADDDAPPARPPAKPPTMSPIKPPARKEAP